MAHGLDWFPCSDILKRSPSIRNNAHRTQLELDGSARQRQKAGKAGGTTGPQCNGQIWVGEDGPPDQNEERKKARPPHHVVHGWSTAINKVLISAR
jgi:hypothetical protein